MSSLIEDWLGNRVNHEQITLTVQATVLLYCYFDIFLHYLLLITLQASLHLFYYIIGLRHGK